MIFRLMLKSWLCCLVGWSLGHISSSLRLSLLDSNLTVKVLVSIRLLSESNKKIHVEGMIFYKMLYKDKELLYLYFILLYEKMFVLEL